MGLDPGNGGEAGGKGVVESAAFFRGFVNPFVNLHVGRENGFAVPVGPRVDGAVEAVDHQPGDRQQGEGERDLADDEEAANPPLAFAAGGAAGLLLEGFVDVGARGEPGGNEAEAEAGEDRDGRGETKHASIDGYIQRGI